jgi:cardiolipin synthase C
LIDRSPPKSVYGLTACKRPSLQAQIAGIVLLCLTACSSIPTDYPRQDSHAAPASADSNLGAIALQWMGNHGKESGFLGLPNGTEALGARLRMMEAAEHSIDAQYFLLKPDRAGALFVGQMLLAADRGVKVRFLIDDIFTPGLDKELTLLSSHPNIQVRLFNPMGDRSFKYGNYLLDFKRANRRMHNKSFTVDGALSIVGGRNIAEEYFELQQDVVFDDYEVMAIGPVVSAISSAFDQFWNSDLAVPMEAFAVEVDPGELNLWRTQVKKTADSSAQGDYARAVNSSLVVDLMADRVEPVPARAVVVTDSPEKLQAAVGTRELATMAAELGQRFDQAQKEIVIITPYFVPRTAGVEVIEGLLARGIRVVVITNSLASNNHTAVHSGYARYRKRLIKAGAELYEIKADEVGDWEDREGHPELLTLHTKAAIIDRETVFIGSLNFDPRSLDINSEMGLFISSDTVGAEVYDMVSESMGGVTYRVIVNDKDQLRWVFDHQGKHEVLDKEPLTTWGRRFSAGFYRILHIEGQL